jgi:hypothetical protein
MADWTCERTRTAAASAHDVLTTTRAAAGAPAIVAASRSAWPPTARGGVTP